MDSVLMPSQKAMFAYSSRSPGAAPHSVRRIAVVNDSLATSRFPYKCPALAVCFALTFWAASSQPGVVMT